MIVWGHNKRRSTQHYYEDKQGRVGESERSGDDDRAAQRRSILPVD